jgi:hypothetical protein
MRIWGGKGCNSPRPFLIIENEEKIREEGKGEIWWSHFVFNDCDDEREGALALEMGSGGFQRTRMLLIAIIYNFSMRILRFFFRIEWKFNQYLEAWICGILVSRSCHVSFWNATAFVWSLQSIGLGGLAFLIKNLSRLNFSLYIKILFLSWCSIITMKQWIELWFTLRH